MFVPNWDQVSLLTNLKKLWYKIKMCMCWKVQWYFLKSLNGVLVVLRVHTRVFRCFIQCKTCIFFPSFTYNVILFVNFCNCRKFCSAPPPPLQEATFSRGVVTMRCDISTSSSAHISLLVSGSADACFNDQAWVNWIVNVRLFTWLLS
jgi:hypothetical protein